MKSKILSILTLISLLITPMAAVPAVAYAASPPPPSCGAANTAKGQVFQGIGQTGSDCDSSGVTKILNVVVNILSILVGTIAIIMIVISGFKYVVSGGDSGKISSAKSTLIYALVGVVIVALAQAMVHFVINRSAA